MADKLSLSVFYQHRTIAISRPPAALVQTVRLCALLPADARDAPRGRVLEDACATLKIDDPTRVKLVLEKGEKQIDHSISLRLANIKSGTKLAIVASDKHAKRASECADVFSALLTTVALCCSLHLPIVSASPSRSPLVSLTLQCGEATFTAAVPVRSSLFGVLEQLEAAHAQQWTAWHGIPPPEINSGFELHINVPGYMQPVVEIGARRVATNDELRALTLANLGVQSDTATPAKLKLKLSHSYTAPVKTAEEQKEIMDNFQRMYASATSPAGPPSAAKAPAPAQQSLPLPLEEEEEDVNMSDDDDDEPPTYTIPADRGVKLFHALPGLLQPPELPEEFYEVTEADSLAYARGLRAEVAKLARNLTPAQVVEAGLDQGQLNPVFAPRGASPAAASSSASASAPPASTISVGRNGLLDSSRLPPVASAQERRNARVKRKCRASLLRVRLPNHLYAEGLFGLEETPRELYQWLDTLLAPHLTEQKDAYYLYITPPRQVMSRTSRLTLTQLGLYPQALVHLGTEGGREQAHATGAFTVAADTPEEIAAKAQPARGVLREDRWAAVVEVQPPTPAAASANESQPTQTSESTPAAAAGAV